VINVGSTVVGNIFTTILKQPINKKITKKKISKSFEKASGLFAGIENTITTTSKIQEKNIDIKKYDAQKMKEIIALSKKEKDLKNKAPKIKQLITTITKFAFVPNGVAKVVAVLTMNSNNTNTNIKSKSRSIGKSRFIGNSRNKIGKQRSIRRIQLSQHRRTRTGRKSKKKQKKNKKTKKVKKSKRSKRSKRR
jgi:hypothetical protein